MNRLAMVLLISFAYLMMGQATETIPIYGTPVECLPTKDLGIIRYSNIPPRHLGQFSQSLAALDDRVAPLDRNTILSDFDFGGWKLTAGSDTDYAAHHYFDHDSMPPELLDNFPFLDAGTQKLQTQAGEFLDRVAGKSGGLGRLMTKLNGLEKVKFPVGIQDTIGEGIVVTIAIEGVTFTERFARLRNVFMSVHYTRYLDMKPLIFGAAELVYSRTAGFREARVGLIGDFNMPINENNKMLLVLKGYDPITKEGCVATFGCDGYESIQLSSTLYLSRKLVEPVTPQGEPLPGYVHADLDGYFNSLDDWIGTVSFQQNFKVAGIDQVVFTLRDATFDASETRTANNVEFPSNYFADSTTGYRDTWQGLYIQEIGFSLDKFAEIESTDNRNLGGHIQNLIIDKMGLTAYFAIGDPENPVISLEQGKIGNSRISVDHIAIDIYKNQAKDLRAGGQVALGAMDDGAASSGLLYQVMVAENGWQFTAGLNEGRSLPFPLLKGRVLIDPGTTLSIGHSDETQKTEIQINLCATVDLDKIWPSPDSTKNRRISVENFVLQSASPTIQNVGVWEIPGSIPLNVGPVHFLLHDISAGQSATGEVILAFTADASFSDSKGFDISGIAGVQIYGKEDPDLNNRLVYDRTEVSKVGLCVATESWGAAVELIWFENDGKFGDGFMGRAAVGLKCMGYEQQEDCNINAGIYARALFGKRDSTRYYNFELLYVDLDEGLELGALAIHALGGSVSNNLLRAGIEQVAFESINYADTAEVIATEKAVQEGISDPSIGRSLLGMTYEPNDAAGFSIRLMSIAAVRKKASMANMRAELVFAFNVSGGLDSIRMDVQGQMFADLALEKMEFADIPVSFKAVVLYDNINKIFDLAAQVTFDIGSGSMAVQGGGNLKIHAERNKGWYIHIGYPGEQHNIGLTIPLVSAKTNTYICAGSTNVPDMPLLPAPIRNMFSSTTTERQFNTGDELGGLAFGTHLSLGSPEEKNFFIFYYKLHVLLGFDVNLRNYKDYLCGGYSDFGVNKWYAKGQAYAYIHGAIGLRSGSQKFPILDLEAGFKIYLETPNPSYGEFGVAIKYKVLGGLIRGRAKIEASFGEKCFMDRGRIDVSVFDEVIAPVNDQALNVAQDITFSSGVQFEQHFPDDMGQQKLRVQLKDNIASDATDEHASGSSIWADRDFVDMNDDQIDDNTLDQIPPGWYAYQESLIEKVALYENPSTPTNWSKMGFAFYKEDGITKTISCTKVYTEDNTFVTYIPQETWPPNSEIWLQPQAHFQQSPASENQWKSVSDQDGNTFQDTIYRFHTGSYPKKVPPFNIDWTYPVNGMTNFYPRQFSRDGGHVGMVQLRKGMSPLLEKLNVEAQMVCHDYDSGSLVTSCSYDPAKKLIYWSIPPDQIQPEALYTISFIADGKEVIEPIHFRSSKYDDLNQKLMSINERIGAIEMMGTSRIFIPMDAEPFDEVELYGNGQMPPLLTFSYDLQPLRDQQPFVYDHISDESLNLDRNFFMQTYFSSNDAFQEIPTIEVQTPDQIGAKPTMIDASVLRQYLVSNVHLAFMRAKADLALPQPYNYEERLSDALYTEDVDDWMGTWQHPPTMKIHWNYTIGDIHENFTFEWKVNQKPE